MNNKTLHYVYDLIYHLEDIDPKLKTKALGCIALLIDNEVKKLKKKRNKKR